jgi:serine/threonine-protein kinase
MAEASNQSDITVADGVSHEDSLSAPAEDSYPRLLTERYRLERLIAKGGMGRVYLATQLPLGRQVALKHLVRPSVNHDFHRRFFLEASVLARLSHPNIVVVHDYGEAPDGSLFMAMEYLDGVTLLDTLRRQKRFSPMRACYVAAQVCRALRAAHRQGVAHRDLKPGNVMLLHDAEEGRAGQEIVKVLDFGLVKVFQDHEETAEENEMTHAEVMLGSPRYMAPEQIQCQKVDARADVYSLGVVLFAMLVGRPPFVGTTLEILNQHLEAPVPGLNQLTQEVKGFDVLPSEVEPLFNKIIQRCMAKAPNDRYPSMDQLLLDLRTAYRLLADDSMEIPSGLDITHPGLASVVPPPFPSMRQAMEGSGLLPAISTTSPPAALVEAPRVVEIIPAQPQPTPPGFRRWLAVMFGLLLLLSVGFVWLWQQKEDLAASIHQGMAPSLPVRPAPAAVSTVVTVTSQPPGATVTHDGRELGPTPLRLSMPLAGGPVEASFEFSLTGHTPTTLHARVSAAEPSVHAVLRPQLTEGGDGGGGQEPAAAALGGGATTGAGTVAPPSRRRAPARPPQNRSLVRSTTGGSLVGDSARTGGSGSRTPAGATGLELPARIIVEESRRHIPVVD